MVEGVRAGDELRITVRDFGSWRSPRAGSQGRGLGLIEDLMDSVEIERGPTGTQLQMSRRLKRDRQGART